MTPAAKASKTEEQESLFPIAQDPVVGSKKEAIAIEVEKIAFDPNQPRRDGEHVDLSDILESVRIEGVLEPVLVRKTDAGYMLVNGERRLRATLAVGRKTIRAFVAGSAEVEAVDEIHRLVRQLISNRHLEMKAVDEAVAIKRIHDAYPHLTMQQLATTVGRKKSTVMDRLALAEAPTPFQSLFASNTLGASAAPIVKKYKDVPAEILAQIVEAVKEDFTWKRHIEKGEPVPNKDVEDALHYEMTSRFDEVDDALALFYNGPTIEIDKVVYSTNTEAYVDATKAKKAADAEAAKASAKANKSAAAPETKATVERTAATESPSQRKAREKVEREQREAAEFAQQIDKASSDILNAIGVAVNKAPAKPKSPLAMYLQTLMTELGFNGDEARKRIEVGTSTDQLIRFLVFGVLAAEWKFPQNRGRFPAILKELGLKVDIRAIVAQVAKQSAKAAPAKASAKPSAKKAAPKKAKRGR